MGHDRTRATVLAALVLAMAGQPRASAQLQLPSVPPVQVPGVPGIDATRVTGPLNDTLRAIRSLRVTQLLRIHPRELERDPGGELIVRHEVLAFSPADETLARLAAAGFSVRREQNLAGLGARIVVIAAPAGSSTRRAIERIRQLDPGGSYDFNHIYLDGGEVEQAGDASAVPPVTATAAQDGGAPGALRIGLIDRGVDGTHAVFARATIVRSGCDGADVPSPHGTAVASLLVDALPDATVYAADVFCDLPVGGASDRIVAALDWMARENVAVVNVSLVGPRNLLVENATRLLVARSVLVVAAVGNDGPGALPLFPAAYPGVVGVTAVDAKNRVLLEACRGEHVDYASRGADLEAVGGPDGWVPVRGTSFAAPLVAARLALAVPRPDPVAANAALANLSREAIDLGRRGRDIIYGNGFITPIVVEQGRK